MGILSGLKNMGVNLEDDDIFKEDKPQEKKVEAPKVKVVQPKAEEEADFVLARSYTCPICEKGFKSLNVKANRARLVSSDIDLRPVHAPLDTLKYSIISCPVCGYSALQRNFDMLTNNQKKALREKLLGKFQGVPGWQEKTTYSYDDAIRTYQLALATAVGKGAKSSEKAYICLMMAWVVRGQKESLDENAADYKTKLADCEAAEKELLQNACDGFVNARATEDFPMCGYDQYTIDYLLSALLYETGKYDASLKLLSELITSQGAGSRIKDRARSLKDLVTAAKA